MSLFAEDFGKIERELDAGFAEWREGIANSDRKKAEAGHKKVKEGTERLLRFVNVQSSFVKHLGEHILFADELILERLKITDRTAFTRLLGRIEQGLGEIRTSANVLLADRNMLLKDTVLTSNAWNGVSNWYFNDIKQEIAKLNELSAEDVALIKVAIAHARTTKVRSRELERAVRDLGNLENELKRLK